jgi:hypothetical protein
MLRYYLSLLLFVSVNASACPDLSGKYHYSLMPGLRMNIQQTKCESMKIENFSAPIAGLQATKTVLNVKIPFSANLKDVVGKQYWDNNKYVAYSDMRRSKHGIVIETLYKEGKNLIRTVSDGKKQTVRDVFLPDNQMKTAGLK